MLACVALLVSLLHIRGAAAGPWLGIEIEKDAAGGARITDILPESPITRGRVAIGRGDVVVSIDGAAVQTPADLQALMRRLQVGQRVRLGVRGAHDSRREVEVLLAERIAPEILQVKTLLDRPAPDFAARGVSGPELPAASVLASLRGTPVVLDFFATWCGPCMNSIPRLSMMQRRYPGLRVIGLSYEQPELLRAMVSRMQPSYTVAHDADSQAGRSYRIYSYPTLVLVDRSGVVRTISHGDLGQLEAAVAAQFAPPGEAEEDPRGR